MPMSLINKYREGLIIGSACEAGELFRAIVDDASDEEIVRLVNWFDYLEIQPLGNNEFMTRDTRNPKTMDDLIGYNKRIVELGEMFNKPVVATCDVHFMDPQDATTGFLNCSPSLTIFLFISFRSSSELIISCLSSAIINLLFPTGWISR